MDSIPPLEVRRDRRRIEDLIAQTIRNHAAASGTETLQVLEAGCGRKWPYRLDGVKYALTGIDTDAQALESRKAVEKDLDETIVGDLRTVDLGNSRFDVIYNSFVLEHVSGARTVLENFSRWVKPGGLIILKFPDRDTVFGFATRLSPFWAHVAYKKYLMGYPNAGKPGYAPYPTYYDEVISRRSFREFAQTHGLRIDYECAFGNLPPVQKAFVKIVSVFSLGKLATHQNLLYILRDTRGRH